MEFVEINGYFKKRQGSVIVFVLIAFMIISIFGFSILFMFNTNLKQAKKQQDRLEAYYLAYSGAEMAFASLLKDGNENLRKLTEKKVAVLEEENIKFGNGKITVISKITDNENFPEWIEVMSTAILDRNNLSYTRTLYFDPSNPIDMVWKDE